jgi:hypothetical protein
MRTISANNQRNLTDKSSDPQSLARRRRASSRHMTAKTAIERCWSETMHGSFTETSHRADRVHRLNDGAIDYYRAQSRRLRDIAVRAARRRVRR